MGDRQDTRGFPWALVVVLGLLAGCGAEAPYPTAEPATVTAKPATATLERATATLRPPTATASPSPDPATATASPQALPLIAQWPTRGWQISTPEEQGMDSAILAEMFKYLPSGPLQERGMMSVLIVRHGYLVLEAYFHPYDESWRDDIFSCTKSVTSMLVGIALAEGYIESVDQRVVDFFPERTIQNLDERKRSMTVEDLLTMRTGLDWWEAGVDPSDPNGFFQRWARSDDWVQFVLDRPVRYEPGHSFEYSTGASHLLSAIIQQTTGMTAFEFAREHLFQPLGITDVGWLEDPQGVNSGGYGLLLRPRDMAKLGYLYLRQGEWDGAQIVPAAWVQTSTQAHTDADNRWPDADTGYGYQWWVYPHYGIYGAFGYKGQAILVAPEEDVVGVFTQWGVEDTAGENALWLLRRFALYAIQSDGPLPANPGALAQLEAAIEAVSAPPSSR